MPLTVLTNIQKGDHHRRRYQRPAVASTMVIALLSRPILRSGAGGGGGVSAFSSSRPVLSFAGGVNRISSSGRQSQVRSSSNDLWFSGHQRRPPFWLHDEYSIGLRAGQGRSLSMLNAATTTDDDSDRIIVEEEYNHKDGELVSLPVSVASFDSANLSDRNREKDVGYSYPSAATLGDNNESGSTNTPFEVTAKFDPAGDQPEAIRQLLEQLQVHKDRFSVLQGITGTGKTLVMSHLIAKQGRPTLVLCHNKTLAAQVARELRSFLGKNAVELFVSFYNHYVPESYNEVTGRYGAKKSSINHDIDAMRHRATRALLTRDDVVIVASVSCIYGLGMPQEYLDASTTVTVDDTISSPDEFMATLDAMLYQQAPQDDDFERGKYQASKLSDDRWDIALWPPHESFPLRIELELEEGIGWKIRCVQQGHSGGHNPIATTRLMPAKHHVMAEDRVEEACLAIEEECEHRVKELVLEGKLEEANRLQQRVVNDMLMMRETGFCSGAENYSRHLTGRQPGEAPATLMDYFSMQGRKWTLMIDESHVTLPQLRAMYAGDRARKERLIKHGYRLPSALDNRPLKEDEFWERVQQGVFISATPSNREIEWSEHDPVEMVVRPTFVCDPQIHVKPKEGQLADLAEAIRTRATRQERTLAVTLTKRDAEDLSDYLNEQDIPSAFIHSGLNTQERAEALKSLQSGEIDCLVGVCLLREGLDLPQVSLVAILNADSEGFLRSETALLQMVGRAARNVGGEAIFYANRITKSMQKCMDATESRRQKQLAYNLENGCSVKSTKGSSMQSIFDLLKDQIAQEQPLEIVGRKEAKTAIIRQQSDVGMLRPDVTVHINEEQSTAEVTTDHVPAKPGVYFWKDAGDNVLYIGKAKKLRSRIRSYLAPGAKHSKRIQVMIKKAQSIDFLITNSDRDALLLESNLIKHHQPPYNVLLKDDQSYPYICASIGDSFPRFFVVPRRQEENQSTRKYRYFGPYPHFKEINAVLEGIEAKYDLRAKSFEARHGSAELSNEGYNKLFQRALDENFDALEMLPKTALAELRSEYEEAGLLFDPDLNHSRDVVAIAKIPGVEGDRGAVVHLVQFRDGLVTNRFSYDVELNSGNEMWDDDEDCAAAIQQVLERRHYPSCEESPGKSFSYFPEETLLQFLPDDTKELKHTIRSSRKKVEPLRTGKTVLKRPAKRGGKKDSDKRAMDFAMENAKQVAYERSLERVNGSIKSSVDGTALSELATLLNLDKAPIRIECYDVSHNQGDFPVASRVVFVGGRPVKSLYRKFNIKTVDGPDDYASLEETLSRRFKRAWLNGEGGPVADDDAWSLPDLVLIDGGPGQLNAAAKGMAKARIFPADGKSSTNSASGNKWSATVAVCSLAKNQEELFMYGQNKAVNEAPDTPALLLLRALRDESHRFALNAHRSRRSLTKST